jgi:hypothetical protein
VLRSVSHRYIRLWLPGIVLATASCGPPTIYDVDLNPVRSPRIIASVGNGWFAIDSTAAGIRGILELQIEGPPAAAEYVALHMPALRCSSAGIHRPIRVRREAPRCTSPGAAEACTPQDLESGACARMFGPRPETCLHVVRAEFAFERIPHLDESHYVTFAQMESPVRWVRNP